MVGVELGTETGVPGGPAPEAEAMNEACAARPMGRALLGLAAVGAAATTLAGCPTAPAPETVGDPYDGPAPAVLPANLKRLVDRITFGANARETNLASQLGYDGYLEYHLNPNAIDDADCERQVKARFPGITLNPKQLIDRLYTGDYAPYDQFIGATIFRATYSRRQLFERIVEFWTDHFNIYIDKDGVPALKMVDDREVIRKHALDPFPTLLSASAHSPAMLVYLDNASSVAEDPNQNYARELMELHTLGEGNYTQSDVVEVARCFTGWGMEDDNDQANYGTFKFNLYKHDQEAKIVLGHAIAAGGGQADGDRVLQMLTQDAGIAAITAQRLARKLAVKFWGDSPPQALVDAVAQAYTASGGDIKAMLRVVLAEEWLSQAPPKFKRPFHLIVSALRARPSQITDFWSIRSTLEQLDHHPFYWIPPNGYPEASAPWMTLLVPRWRLGDDLAGWGLGATIDWSVFESAADDTAFMDAVNLWLGGGAFPFAQLQAIYGLLRDNPNNDYLRRQALGLAFAAPAFQWF